MKVLVLVPVALLYLIPAMMIAGPIYLAVAVFAPQLAMWPGDQSDWMVLLGIAGIWWIVNIVTAPSRLGLAK